MKNVQIDINEIKKLLKLNEDLRVYMVNKETLLFLIQLYDEYMKGNEENE